MMNVGDGSARAFIIAVIGIEQCWVSRKAGISARVHLRNSKVKTHSRTLSLSGSFRYDPNNTRSQRGMGDSSASSKAEVLSVPRKVHTAQVAFL